MLSDKLKGAVEKIFAVLIGIVAVVYGIFKVMSLFGRKDVQDTLQKDTQLQAATAVDDAKSNDEKTEADDDQKKIDAIQNGEGDANWQLKK